MIAFGSRAVEVVGEDAADGFHLKVVGVFEDDGALVRLVAGRVRVDVDPRGKREPFGDVEVVVAGNLDHLRVADFPGKLDAAARYAACPFETADKHAVGTLAGRFGDRVALAFIEMPDVERFAFGAGISGSGERSG